MRAWLLVVSLLALPVAADELSEFEQFRSFPYLDRAYRAVERDDWATVEQLMTHLLDRVPEQAEARRLLVQALAGQGRYAEAEREAARLAGTVEGAEVVLELRLAWIDRDLPAAELVEGWLDDSLDAQDERLWQAYSLALAESQGDPAALAWLQGLPSRPALRRWRAALAERLQDWPAVIAELVPLPSLEPLDWARLTQAYAQQNDDAALRRLLENAPTLGAAIAVQRLAAQRAIAAGRTESARGWLLDLEAADALGEDERLSLWELARQREDIGLVQRLSAALGRPCLETAEWLSRRDASAAYAQLLRCNPVESPSQWLVLAQRLEASELLVSRTLPNAFEDERRRLLVDLWLDQGRSALALEWLAKQPQTDAVLRQRAGLLQRDGKRRAAAELWAQLYRRRGELNALDQASFMLLALGDRDRALALLEQGFDRHDEDLPAAVRARLAELYAVPQTPLSLPRIERLLPGLNREIRATLLGRLAEAGACALVQHDAGDQPEEIGQWRALGRCAMPTRPGEAVVWYRLAAARGDAGSRQALAYALDAAGDASAAHRIWQDYRDADLDHPARLAAARSALGAGHADIAERRWGAVAPNDDADAWRLGAAIAAAQSAPDLALARQRHVLALAPAADDFYVASGLAQRTGQPDLSLAWLREALRRAPDTPRFRAELALRLAAAESAALRREAIPLLEQANNDYPYDFYLAETLALRYQAEGDSAAARRQLRRAIDLEQAPLTVVEDDALSLERRRFRQRRAHEALARRNSITLASTWSPAGIASVGVPTGEASRAENYQIAVWDHALGEEPNRAGRALAVYGRVISGGEGYTRYGESLGVGIGLRYKPLGDGNLNLYAELYGESQLGAGEGFHLGDWLNRPKVVDEHLADGATRLDLLLRASASLLDQGDYRNDWRTGQDQWNERSLFLDAAIWTRRGERQLLARYQQGRTFKLPLPGAQTLMPYGFAQATTQTADEPWREDLRAGLGLRWQLQFDDDRYNAYRGRLSLRLEYQQSLGGTLYAKENGWLTGLEVTF